MNVIREYYEEYWEKKFEKSAGDLNPAAKGRLPTILELLPKKEKLGRVLDAGCGDGTILLLLMKYYELEPYGVDISEIAVKKARERGIKAEVCDLSERIPFPDDYFDFVICTEVLEHLVSPEKAVEEMRRCSKKEAVTIFSIPNIALIRDRVRFLRGKTASSGSLFQTKEHLRFWTKASFEQFLKENGFQVERLIGIGGFPTLNKIFRREGLFSRYLFVRATKNLK